MNRAAERSGMNQRSEFPVRENSPKREKQEEKGRSAQEQRTEFPVCENSRRREITRKIADRPEASCGGIVSGFLGNLLATRHFLP